MTQHSLNIGRVTLTVHDLDAVADFYAGAVGLHLLRRDRTVAELGVEGRTLLVLIRDPAAQRHSARQAGLFHTAFLLPSRADLGRWLAHAMDGNTTIAGASDHGVSEAVYLSDPEGNGVEIYADQARSSWRWESGTVAMKSEPLAIRPLLDAAAGTGWQGFPKGAVIGHVHLQVGELAAAERFYRDVIGLAVTCRYRGATFYAADGYHHHIATNIWNSRGAGPRDLPATGLADVELVVSAPVLDQIAARAAASGLRAEPAANGALKLPDPWATAITLVPAATEGKQTCS